MRQVDQDYRDFVPRAMYEDLLKRTPREKPETKPLDVFVVCYDGTKGGSKAFGAQEFDNFEDAWKSCKNMAAHGWQVSLSFWKFGTENSEAVKDWN